MVPKVIFGAFVDVFANDVAVPKLIFGTFGDAFANDVEVPNAIFVASIECAVAKDAILLPEVTGPV